LTSVTDLKFKCGFSRKEKIGHCDGNHEEGSTHEVRFSCPAGYSFQDNIGGEECTLGIPTPAALAMGRKVIHAPLCICSLVILYRKYTGCMIMTLRPMARLRSRAPRTRTSRPTTTMRIHGGSDLVLHRCQGFLESCRFALTGLIHSGN
jgi:hypothetical protein